MSRLTIFAFVMLLAANVFTAAAKTPEDSASVKKDSTALSVGVFMPKADMTGVKNSSGDNYAKRQELPGAQTTKPAKMSATTEGALSVLGGVVEGVTNVVAPDYKTPYKRENDRLLYPMFSR